MAGYAAHAACGRIVDDAAQKRRFAAVPHGHASARTRSVGAMRGRSDAGGRNIVSFMPSGSKMCAPA